MYFDADKQQWLLLMLSITYNYGSEVSIYLSIYLCIYPSTTSFHPPSSFMKTGNITVFIIVRKLNIQGLKNSQDHNTSKR